MSREATVCVLGLMVMLIPFLGLPTLYKERALLLVGIGVVLLGYSLRRRAFLREIERADGERVADSFSEHRPQHDV